MRKINKMLALTATLAFALGCGAPTVSGVEAKAASKADSKAGAAKTAPAKPAAPAAKPAAKPESAPAAKTDAVPAAATAPKLEAFVFEDFHKTSDEWLWKVVRGKAENAKGGKGGLAFETDEKGVLSFYSRLSAFDASQVQGVRVTFASNGNAPAKDNWGGRLYWARENDPIVKGTPFTEKERNMGAYGEKNWLDQNTLIFWVKGIKNWDGNIQHLQLAVDSVSGGKRLNKQAKGVITKVELIKNTK
jgi:hypothetical protein